MADLTVRLLTGDEAVQLIRGAVHAWLDGRISPAEALADIGDALESAQRAAEGDRELSRRIQGET
jgi:hypothetical protein